MFGLVIPFMFLLELLELLALLVWLRMMRMVRVAMVAGVAYAKKSMKHCSGKTTGSSYNSLLAVQAACTSNQKCSGVYDSACDGNAPYYQCKTGIAYGIAYSQNCVYKKSKIGSPVGMHGA